MILQRIEQAARSHRWKDRTPEMVLLCLGLLLACLCAATPVGNLVILGIVLSLALASDIPMAPFLQAMMLPVGFSLLGSAGLLIEIPIHAHSLFHATPGNLPLVALVLSRTFASLSCTLFLAFTTPFPAMLRLARSLHLSETILELLVLVHRSLLRLDEALERMLRAQVSRNGWSSLRNANRSAGLAAGHLLEQCLVLSRRQEIALASRNWNGSLDVLARPVEWRPVRLCLVALVPTLAWFGSRWLEACLGI